MHFSQSSSSFHGRRLPEPGTIVGYGSVITQYDLPVPLPDTIALISEKRRKYEARGWNVYPTSYQPDGTLYKQLIFAIKYEGINLLVFKKLFEKIDQNEVLGLISIESGGQYSRKIWFLYEWLMKEKLNVGDADLKIRFTELIDENIQYGISEGIKSSRHRIINNLLGTVDYCPTVLKSKVLEDFTIADIREKQNRNQQKINKTILRRASAFLLLKDSKASFAIEGESPKSKRTTRWGRAIGQAGARKLDKEELLRLQEIVIENPIHIELGFRTRGGFIGEHDRDISEPLPEHISAKWQDVSQLIEGLIQTNEKLISDEELDPIVAAALVAFGFVFIHPFVDGNGRIHRYLIHHVLVRKKFSSQVMVFPVSSSILEHIDDYRTVLESYSHPLLEFIEWKTTKDHNIEVLNQTSDYYRYFDATKQVEFLYECVNDTIDIVIPEEISFLRRYDEFKIHLDDEIELSDNKVNLLVNFLRNNEGKLSRRKASNHFSSLTKEEITRIEQIFREVFIQE